MIRAIIVTVCVLWISGCSLVRPAPVAFQPTGFDIQDIHVSQKRGGQVGLRMSFANGTGRNLDSVIVGITPYDGEGDMASDITTGKTIAWLELAGPYYAGYNSENIFHHPSNFEDIWTNSDIQCVRVEQVEFTVKGRDTVILSTDELSVMAGSRLFCRTTS